METLKSIEEKRQAQEREATKDNEWKPNERFIVVPIHGGFAEDRPAYYVQDKKRPQRPGFNEFMTEHAAREMASRLNLLNAEEVVPANTALRMIAPLCNEHDPTTGHYKSPNPYEIGSILLRPMVATNQFIR